MGGVGWGLLLSTFSWITRADSKVGLFVYRRIFFSCCVKKNNGTVKDFAFIGLVADEKETEIEKIEPAKIFK